jgi:hypothetical protein
MLISDKEDFKFTSVKQDKEGHFILIKIAVHQKGNNNYQPICTQCHQIYTKGLKHTYRLQYSGSGRLQHSSITNR